MEIEVHNDDIIICDKLRYIVRAGRLVCISERLMQKESVIEAVLTAYGYTMSEIWKDARQRRLCDARRALCYFLMRYSRLTSTGIATTIHRDHATVLHYNASWDECLSADRDIRLMDEKIRELLFEK